MISKEFRPRKFSDIIGQDKTIKCFEKKSVDLSYSDVMFFEGSSGSGKTTTALIIASIINCELPVKNDKGYFDPCLECASCKSVLNETFTQDIHFIKSSEMEKQDIINLEELASYSPLHGGKKNVVVIDEMQNLDKGSKAATLNLLEKKRKDTVFILCTMDSSKIDTAVLDRGQVFKFKSLTHTELGNAIIKNLEEIDPENKIPIPPEVILSIAENSHGSVRKAQQSLQRCIESELYTLEDVESELDFFSEKKGFEIFQALINKETSFFKLISTVKQENFYYYAWSVIGSNQKVLATMDNEDFKYKSAKAMSSSPNYSKLCEAMLEINKTYFKDYIFDYYIGEYMKTVPVMNRIREKK